MDNPKISFKAGTFTATNGQSVTLGQSDLMGMVASYDPLHDPAPVIIGMPQLSDPAYGWVKMLELKNGQVVASLDQVEPSFAEAVKAGQYSKVRASFYPPESGSNPVPGKWYLKSVSFDGMERPKLQIGTVAFGEVMTRGTISFPGEVMGYGQDRYTASDIQSANAMLSFAEASDIASAANKGVVPLPTGYSVDPEAAATYVAAMKLRAQDPTLGMIEAAKLVQRGINRP